MQDSYIPRTVNWKNIIIDKNCVIRPASLWIVRVPDRDRERTVYERIKVLLSLE